MPKFRKKPVEIEAIKFTGVWTDELFAFMRGADYEAVHTQENGTQFITSFKIHTLEGDMAVSKGDWIIRGVQGEFYPCKPDIFEQTYEPVKPEA